MITVEQMIGNLEQARDYSYEKQSEIIFDEIFASFTAAGMDEDLAHENGNDLFQLILDEEWNELEALINELQNK